MDDVLIGGNNTQYICNHTKQYNQICTKHINGKHKTYDNCIHECEDKYIKHNLQQSEIQREVKTFESLIKQLLQSKVGVYIQGGNPLGIHILKLMLSVYKDRDKFKSNFDKFLSLNLMKDWDFHCYTYKTIDEAYKKKLEKLAKSLKLISTAKKYILYQTKSPIKISDVALFEASIWENDASSGLESVMSTMKIKITQNNLKYIFMLAKLFYQYSTKKRAIDIDIVMRILDKIDVIIYPHSDGLFVVKPSLINTEELSADLLKMIDTFQERHKYNPNIKQFLITHIKEPKRMYFRLLSKNLPKAENTYKFLKNINLIKNDYPQWLLNVKNINEIVSTFTSDLSVYIIHVYKTDGIYGVFEFLQNVNFKPIRDEYPRFPQQGLKYIKILLSGLYKNIEADINKYINDPKDTGDLILTLNFLQTKHFFDS